MHVVYLDSRAASMTKVAARVSGLLPHVVGSRQRHGLETLRSLSRVWTVRPSRHDPYDSQAKPQHASACPLLRIPAGVCAIAAIPRIGIGMLAAVSLPPEQWSPYS